VNLRQILLGIALSLGLTLATVSHAQSPWWRWWHDTTAPTAPTGLSVSAVTPTTLTLSWTPATDNVAVTGYNVYLNSELLFSSTSTSVEITDLTPGFTRAFTVTAFDAARNVSAHSAPLSVTTPPLAKAPVPPAPAPVPPVPVPPAPVPPVPVPPAPVPPPPPAPVPAPTAQVLWSAGMETGDLNQWSEKVNTGNADSAAVTAFVAGIPPKTGNWVLRQAWYGSSGVAEASGTRMAQYPVVDKLARAGTTFYYSWWNFFPAALSFGASGWYGHWEIMSNDSTMKNAPIWVLNIDSGMTMSVDWSPNGLAPTNGPHNGETGSKTYRSPIVVPTGQWVFFEVMVTPRGDFTGALKVWMNGQVLFDFSSVKTQFPLASQSLFTYINIMNYGTGLSPTPFVHYVDDVTISLGRMPHP